MDRLVLKTKELLLLSSQIGASNFYGIADPFFGMTKDEVWGEIPQLQQKLEDRGLVSFGFDGTVEIRKDVQEAISTCALCEKYITVDAIVKGSVFPRTVLYRRGDHAVELTQKPGEVSLVDTAEGDFVYSVMSKLFSDCGDDTKPDAPVPIPQSVLQNAQRDTEAAERILRQNNCPEGMAAVIASGLNRTGGYCVISSFDLSRNSVTDFVCVVGKSGAVRLEVWTDAETTWRASWIRKSEILEMLHDIIQQKAPHGGDANEAQ